MAGGAALSSRATNYYDHLMTLSQLIDQGDAAIGLPPYNGGLFNDAAAPLLASVRLPDAAFAPIIYDLSHTETPEGRRFVNYRDMSVQQLGSIYERLLEREPVWDDDGNVVARPNSYARKDSGSFFTPQELVDLIVDRTLKPLAEERLAAFAEKAVALASDPRPRAERYGELRQLDPAEAVLDLKVLDPAMGSGHFLVTAVDFLSDYIAEMVEHAPGVPEWLDGEYVSPLVERVAAIRQDISQRAQAADWVMDQAQLTDQAIIRRMVLKRCIYGVDKNPLTVELAKVSLWLHSFTVGAPLSFLDHHLRCWRLSGRTAGNGSHRGAEPSGRPVRHFGHNRSGSRHGRDGAYRGDVRRRHLRGPAVGDPVPGCRGYDRRLAQPAGPPDRFALADRRHEAAGAPVVRNAAGRYPRRAAGRGVQPAGAGTVYGRKSPGVSVRRSLE